MNSHRTSCWWIFLHLLECSFHYFIFHLLRLMLAFLMSFKQNRKIFNAVVEYEKKLWMLHHIQFPFHTLEIRVCVFFHVSVPSFFFAKNKKKMRKILEKLSENLLTVWQSIASHSEWKMYTVYSYQIKYGKWRKNF